MKTQELKSKLNILLITLLFFNSFSNTAQNSGPHTPEAMSFEPVDATDMVNLVTGDFSYVLPLLEIPGTSGGYPIALSYHAGITMDQEASWVGLGWNINPGAINRSVNETPDDWKSKTIRNIIHDDGGEAELYEISAGYGINDFTSVGLSASWGTNKAFGGDIHFNVERVGISAGESGVGMSYRTFGMENDVNNISGSIVANIDSKGQSSIGFRVGMGSSTSLGNYAQSCMGISLSSQNGFNMQASSAFGSFNFNPEPVSSSDWNYSTKGWYIPIYFKAFYFTISYELITYWLYQNRHIDQSGVLYPESGRKIKEWVYLDQNYEVPTLQAYDCSMDINVYPYSKNNYKDPHLYESENCFTFPAYDQYSVNAQGISGTMSPKIFESASIVSNTKILSIHDNGNSKEEIRYYYPDSDLDRFKKDYRRIYFYFDYLLNSYLEVQSGDFYHYASQSNNALLRYKYNGGNYSHIINGSSNFNQLTERKGNGRFVQWFTNKDLANNLATITNDGFRESASVTDKYSRLNETIFDPDGIGAFCITNESGVTYHFALPAYQFEEIYRDESDSHKDFYEIRNINKYATSWLLTSVTGPDYVDVNADGYANLGDYGYWINFNYGKWTDGFIWRLPYSGYNWYHPVHTHYTYSWGRRQAWYLNSIESASHTAYFIKSLRSDGKASMFSTNGSYIEKEKIKEVLNDASLVYCNNQSNKWPGCASWVQYNLIQNHTINVTYKHDALKLDKIILVRNTNVSNVSTVNPSNSELVENAPLDAGFLQYQTKYDITLVGGLGCTSDPCKAHDVNLQACLQDNILDVNDNISELESKALKVIDFNYDYLLCENTPNSDAANGAKLTLTDVTFLGNGGTDVLPPYTFDYYALEGYENYDRERTDYWGYDKGDVFGDEYNEKTHTHNWSLKEITTPLGSKISVNYEGDTYYSEATPIEPKTEKVYILKTTKITEDNIKEPNEYNQFKIKLSLPGLNINDFFQIGKSYWLNLNGNFAPYNKKCGDQITLSTCYTKSLDNNNEKAKIVDMLPDNEIVVEVLNADWSCLFGYQPYDLSQNCDYLASTYGVWIMGRLNHSGTLFYGGGIRVKSIELNDLEDNIYKTVYNYNNPATDNTSGITSFTPIKINPYSANNPERYLPYKFIIPSPQVMYGNVAVSNYNANNELELTNEYTFNVLKPATDQDEFDFSLGDFLHVEDLQEKFNLPNSTVEILKRRTTIHDNKSMIGSIAKKITKNKYSQIIQSTEYKYMSNEDKSTGITQDNFYSRKGKLNLGEYGGVDISDWYLNSSSIRTYPSVLESISTTSGGITTTTINDEYDFNSGKVLSTTTTSSTGEKIKSKVLPAYLTYEVLGKKNPYKEMGSKVDDITYKNMLHQEAANFVIQLDESGNESGVLSSQVQTWKKSWPYRNYTGKYEDNTTSDVWRKNKTFVWNGEINENGTYKDFNYMDEIFSNWQTKFDDESVPGNWINITETTRYSHYSVPLESKDINNNFYSTKLSLQNEFIIGSIANSNYCSFGCSGFEQQRAESSSFTYGGEITSNSQNIIYTQPAQGGIDVHSGRHCVKIPADAFGPGFMTKTNELNPDAGLEAGRIYSASIWIHESSPEETKLIAHLTGKNSTNGEIINNYKIVYHSEISLKIGSWSLLKLEFEVPANYISTGSGSLDDFRVYIWNTGSSPAYVDDFRVHPLDASITTYVYDTETGNLVTTLDKDNMGTFYNYDDAGRLIEVYVETVNGRKKLKSYNYNYARSTESE